MSFLYYVTLRGKLAQQCYDISLLDDDDVRNGKLNIWTVNLVTHIHSQCSNPALNLILVQIELGSYWFKIELCSYWFKIELGSYWFKIELGSYWFKIELGSYWFKIEYVINSAQIALPNR